MILLIFSCVDFIEKYDFKNKLKKLKSRSRSMVVWMMVCVWCCVVMLWGDVVCGVVWGGMIDFKLFGGFDNGQTDGRTNGHWWL